MSANRSSKNQAVVVELFILKSYSVALAENSLGWSNFSTSESSGPPGQFVTVNVFCTTVTLLYLETH